MNISVIIPVYNAEKYVRRAVKSALMQDECKEVVLVEDRSPDNSLEICKKLKDEFKNVSLFFHENNENKGPGASRNLGVIKSKYDYIAFLDADDYYLENRFKKAVEILKKKPEIDGIYEPVGSVFENIESKDRYFVSHSNEIAMLRNCENSDKLYDYLVSGKHGYIHLNGLLLKKKKAYEVGLIPDLRLHEDTIFTIQLSLLGKLEHGVHDKPIAIRQLHMENTITKPGIDFLKTRCLSYEMCLNWMKEKAISIKKQDLLKINYYLIKYRKLRREKRYLTALLNYLLYKKLKYSNK